MNHVYTRDIFGEYPKNSEDLINLLGRKWKSNLNDLSLFCEIYRTYPKRIIKSLPISSYSRTLTEIFGYQMKVNRVINLGLKVGLLAITSNNFKFNHGYDNIAMTYAINRNVQDLILETNVLYNGERQGYERENNNIKEEEMIKKPIDNNILQKVIISSKKRPDLAEYDDDTLKAAVYKKYPQILKYQKLASYINKNYDWENSPFNIYFEPNIHHHYTTSKSKGYTRFSMRYNSEFMNWPKETRKDWVDQYFEDHCHNSWTDYDVNASIFRVTYLLNNGSWMDYSGDLYEYWYGKEFESSEARKQFKQLCNMVYFNASSASAFQSFKKQYDIDDSLKDGYIGYIESLRNKILETIGNFYDSEIFMHESCIYIGAIKELYIMSQERAIPVYDCFYVECKPETKCDHTYIMKAAIMASANNYYKEYATDLFKYYGINPLNVQN